MLASGKLKHRAMLQKRVTTQDATTGLLVEAWEDVCKIWCAIEPLSARAVVFSQAEQKPVDTRITLRYRADVQQFASRIYYNREIYKITSVLADKDSGKEYLTLLAIKGLDNE